MEVGKFGEFRLIEELAGVLQRNTQPSPGMAGPGTVDPLLIGIGDDTAVWRNGPGLTIATADAMVENVHYRADTTTWYELGWKAMASNLSDVASMGGAPLYALVILALRPDVQVSDVDEMYRGMADICRLFGTRVIGGDVVSSPTACMIGVTVLGETSSGDPDALLRRSGARPGDLLAVTGTVGDSGGGLAMMLEGLRFDETVARPLRQAHAQPAPRVAEGRALVKAGVRAAMDVSDGTVGDLQKMCGASGVAAILRTNDVPVSPALCSAFPDRWLDLALYGGEDYELLFSAPPLVMERALEAMRAAGATPATVIGEIVAGPPGQVTLIDANGGQQVAQRGGWDHFHT